MRARVDLAGQRFRASRASGPVSCSRSRRLVFRRAGILPASGAHPARRCRPGGGSSPMPASDWPQASAARLYRHAVFSFSSSASTRPPGYHSCPRPGCTAAPRTLGLHTAVCRAAHSVERVAGLAAPRDQGRSRQSVAQLLQGLHAVGGGNQRGNISFAGFHQKRVPYQAEHLVVNRGQIAARVIIFIQQADCRGQIARFQAAGQPQASS